MSLHHLRQTGIARAALCVLLASYPSVAAPTVAGAQTAGPAFDSMAVRARGLFNVNRDDFHDFWEPRGGAALSVELPFYLGRVEAGIELFRFEARAQAQPDFTSRYVHLGWGMPWRMPARLTGFAGLRLGSVNMSFDTDAVGPEGRQEQELSVELVARLRRQLTSRLFVDAFGSYRTTFTRKRIRHVYVGLGIGYTFATPGWLEDFLK